MGRSENKVKGGERRIETTGNELERGEVEAVLRNLKRGKVAGEDGLVNEVWRYKGEEVKKGIWEICGIWKREGWPDDWNTGIVVPIVKKGEGRKVEEYRRVTLLWIRPIRFMWEFWKGDLEWRWRRKGWCRKTRRGSGGTWGGDDGEHICDKISNEQGIGKGGGRMWACFLDIRTAFDSLNRGKLWEIMKKKGVSKILRERIREVYVETRNRVRVGTDYGESFWSEARMPAECEVIYIISG